MIVNEASWDRAARIVVGVLLIALAVFGVVGPWGWIGILPLVTGVVGFCPGYRLLGWSSCPLHGREKADRSGDA
jgi:uncharacterized membrane protein YqaE (UPF0057 family)